MPLTRSEAFDAFCRAAARIEDLHLRSAVRMTGINYACAAVDEATASYGQLIRALAPEPPTSDFNSEKRYIERCNDPSRQPNYHKEGGNAS